jgi:two-component SAPR family response regulator
MKTAEIFVIDDDITHKVCIQRTISQQHFSNGVYTFNNGKEALLQLDQNAKKVDQLLVFLDINMPVMNGWGFLDELQNKAYQDKVNVLIMSSSKTMSDKKKSNSYPQVVGYLEKPFESDILIDVIDLFNNNVVIPNLEAKSKANQVQKVK